MIDIASALRRIRPHLPPTPLIPSPSLAQWAGHDGTCVLKCENLQVTGSFKARGALNKVLSLSDEARARGVVTASTGNHGRGVAYALSIAGGRGTVVIPTVTPENKVAALKASGIDVCVHGAESAESEAFARRLASETGRTFISPYNDPEVIAGQGTIGEEILDQWPRVDVAIIAVGGGGLVSGIATAMKARSPGVQIIGCWPENSHVMLASMRAGRVVETREEPTLSDGTAGGVEPDAITLELCRSLIDETDLVSEDEIADGVRAVVNHARLVVEGSAGVAVGTYRRLAAHLAGKTVAIVLCGGNISSAKLSALLRAAGT
jgi:threonine dehydratase